MCLCVCTLVCVVVREGMHGSEFGMEVVRGGSGKLIDGNRMFHGMARETERERHTHTYTHTNIIIRKPAQINNKRQLTCVVVLVLVLADFFMCYHEHEEHVTPTHTTPELTRAVLFMKF